ncbi:MAG: hypothetical protein MUD10_01070 [Candidatus Pacebacteria bacterium]|jgi:hypothetical protein|nr:hypothetical protein [Candidatus Paceibacterota bacterium]
MDRKTADKKSGRKERSGAYPLIALSPAIDAAKRLFENYGAGPHTRDNLAKGLGYASFSGAASVKIGALVHFGLLERQRGTYAVTLLAKEIFEYPKEGSEAAVLRAALNPALYAKLAARFGGEALPRELPRVLAADFRITEKAAPAAAANFLETMEFAGMLRDGRLDSGQPAPPEASVMPPRAGMPVMNPPKPGLIRVALPSGIEISFPQEMSFRLSMGEFAEHIKNLDERARGIE